MSFSIVKIMFPTLFKGVDIQFFHCNVSEYAKQTCVSSPISNKRTYLFFLIYSDIGDHLPFQISQDLGGL